MASLASRILRRLLDEYLSGTIGAELFCANFEQEFNFGVDRAALTESESQTFETLFNAVVWFSPFADTEEYPAYKDECDIRNAAQSAQKALN